MARQDPNLLRSEIKAATGVDATTYEIFRKKIIRTYMDAVEKNNRQDYDDRLIKETNKKCDSLGLTGSKIPLSDAGGRFTGHSLSGVPSPTYDGIGNQNYFNNENFTGFGGDASNPNDYIDLILNYNGLNIDPQVSGPLYFNSPLHLNTSNYQSIIGSQLTSKESYHLLDDGQIIGFGDEGGSTPELAQERILKMFGQGNTIISYNDNLDRTFSDAPGNPPTPIVCVSDNSSIPGFFGGPETIGHWIKYEFCQLFGNSAGATSTIPAGATGCSFGAYVKVPSNDPLQTLNFGGISVRTMSDTSNNSADSRVDVDIVQVKGSNFTQNSSFMGTTNYAVQTNTTAHHNWGYGLDFDSIAAGYVLKLPPTYVNTTRVRTHQTKLQDDCRDWTLLSGNFVFDSGAFVSGGSNLTLQLTLFYNENIQYLEGGFGLAGSIHFSQPFITFHN